MVLSPVSNHDPFVAFEFLEFRTFSLEIFLMSILSVYGGLSFEFLIDIF